MEKIMKRFDEVEIGDRVYTRNKCRVVKRVETLNPSEPLKLMSLYLGSADETATQICGFTTQLVSVQVKP